MLCGVTALVLVQSQVRILTSFPNLLYNPLSKLYFLFYNGQNESVMD